METKLLLNKLSEKKDLTQKEAAFLIDEIAQGKLRPTQVAALLTGLKVKGESVEEILGCIEGMRKNMEHLNDLSLATDIVGTGGDGAGTFNVSTATALVVAGAGVKVAKHGNRAASSRCGSADVLEELGVNINLTPPQAEEIFKKVGLVFLFAPLYHPAMKHIAPVRKELGFRTIFNFLGPFLNPAGVKRILLGVASLEVAQNLAKVASKLEYESLLMVVSEEGVDEITLSAKTTAFEIKGTKVKKFEISPEELGFEKSELNKILGGDASQNAEIIKGILKGEKGPFRETVVLNSAFGLIVSGKAKDIKEGISMAEKSIDSGNAQRVLDNLTQETKKYA